MEVEVIDTTMADLINVILERKPGKTGWLKRVGLSAKPSKVASTTDMPSILRYPDDVSDQAFSIYQHRLKITISPGNTAKPWTKMKRVLYYANYKVR